MAASARRALPRPVGADVPDVPLWLTNLTNALDWDLFLLETAGAPPAAAIAGRVHRNTATGVLSFDTGAAWITIVQGGPYLPLAGGVLTGALTTAGVTHGGTVDYNSQQAYRPTIRKASLAKVTNAAATGAMGVDCDAAHVFDWTPTGNISGITLSNVPASEFQFRLIIRMGGTLRTIAWPAAFKWAGAVAPSLAINQRSEFSFATVDGGTTWDAITVGQGFA